MSGIAVGRTAKIDPKRRYESRFQQKINTAINLMPGMTNLNTDCTYETNYSWIALARHTHEKSIPERTRRTMAIPRPPLESSWRGESRHFLCDSFDLFLNNFPDNA